METHRLARRPEARAFSVEALLQLVRDGKIRVPDFQRPLRWRLPHVLDLFDSVYRGFPVGDLLFVKQPAPAARLRVGPVGVDAPAASDAYFVVDGQQRITALAGAMLHPEPRPSGDIYAIWFDLEAERFVPGRGAQMPPGWIPLNVVADSVALLTWLADWPYRAERHDLVQRAIALGKALREYQIPAYIVEGASEDVLRLIFKRVNTSGVAMTESDVFGALFRGDEPHPIESACARLATTTGFGNVSSYWFLRCLKAVEGLNVAGELAEQTITGLDARAVERTENALLRVIRFFIEDAGIAHFDLLPYPLPLVVLARFFRLHPSPLERTRVLLSRWLWRGALAHVHGNFGDSALQSASVLIDQDEIASAERLLALIPKTAMSVMSSAHHLFLSTSLRWQDAMGPDRLLVLATAALGARDPETGEPLGGDELRALLDEKRVGDIFLDVEGLSESAVSRRVLVSSYDKIDKLENASDEVLMSHGIDREAADALARGDIETFAKRREATLEQALQRFFVGKVGLDDGDRPPIDELIRRVNKALAAE